jgi:enoyl-CoA hydratase
MADGIILTRVDDHVGVIQLNRPEVYNAVSFEMLGQLAETCERFDADERVHVILIHGSDKAFSAGADIKDMSSAEAVHWYQTDPLLAWERLARIRKPMIAAVSGFAFGGGCELAMTCDIIIAAESAKFGQPEVKIGIMPGAGGTQRLIRAVGKSLAMDMILSGRPITADEALRAGLVARVSPDDQYLEDATNLAQELANGRSPIALRVAKEAVLKAYESFLSQGLRDERDLFYLLCATEDHTEGMKAFLDKRPPRFTGR